MSSNGEQPSTSGASHTQPAGSGEQDRKRLWTDFDLNGATPMRVRPVVGDWGPEYVPSTRAKRRLRWWTPILCTAITILLVAAGWIFYLQVR